MLGLGWWLCNIGRLLFYCRFPAGFRCSQKLIYYHFLGNGGADDVLALQKVEIQ